MLCPYIRSSSANQFKTCEMRYFFEYVLGYKSPTGKAACLGTMFHKTMEIRSLAKKAMQSGLTEIDDDNFGKLTIDQCKDYKFIHNLSWDYYRKIEKHLAFDDSDHKKIIKWIENTLVTYPQYDPLNLNIIEAELFFDIPIEKEWAKYDGWIGDEHITGQLHIKGTMDTVIALSDNVYELLDYKGLPVDTLIPTPDGFKTMGDLSIGDVVFDQYGKKCIVTNKSNKVFKPCYKITFDDTSIALCDNEHYWKLDTGKVVQVENLKTGDKINVAKPLDCEEAILPIDPYVLGVWLGDGRVRSSEISSADPFVFEEIERRGFQLGKNIAFDKNKICKQKTVFGLRKLLRKNNLLYNKHIPEIYLRASYNQRLDLLRGLMDSDGSVNPLRKQCIFSNCNKQLSKNVTELLLTLGQRPLMNTIKTVCKKQNYTGVGYPVSFRPIGINPFLLQKKACKINESWGGGSSNKRTISSIETIDKKLTQCITVNSPDSTYLCTEKFIPTHNTGQYRKDFATGEEKDLKYLENDLQLLLYLIALKTKYPDKEFILTLFYINNGGLFSVAADDDMLDRAWKMLEKTYKEISKTYTPKQLDPTHRDFRCRLLCPFSKKISEQNYVNIETDDHNNMSLCNFFKNQISKNGFTKVTSNHIDMKTFGSYGSGGGRQDVNK